MPQGQSPDNSRIIILERSTQQVKSLDSIIWETLPSSSACRLNSTASRISILSFGISQDPWDSSRTKQGPPPPPLWRALAWAPPLATFCAPLNTGQEGSLRLHASLEVFQRRSSGKGTSKAFSKSLKGDFEKAGSSPLCPASTAGGSEV